MEATNLLHSLNGNFYKAAEGKKGNIFHNICIFAMQTFSGCISSSQERKLDPAKTFRGQTYLFIQYLRLLQ